MIEIEESIEKVKAKALEQGLFTADELYKISDIRLQNSILRNFIQTKDLSFYKFAIDNTVIEDEISLELMRVEMFKEAGIELPTNVTNKTEEKEIEDEKSV